MSAGDKTYQMLWDCAYCGQKKLLGLSHRHCPECGAPQDADKRYYPPEGEEIAVEDHQFVGADLACPACGQAQSARVKHCGNCGSPLGQGRAVVQRADQLTGPGGAVQPAVAVGAQPPAAPKRGRGKIAIIIGVVVLLVVGFIVARMFLKKDAAIEVSGHAWTREIAIERYGEVEESGACSSMPSRARLIRRTAGKEKCKTRRVDQGDGTFKKKKECTKAEDQCRYAIKKWKTARTLRETGEGLDSSPRWPAVSLPRTGNCEGCEREGTRSEHYVVRFRDAKSGDKLRCSFGSAAKWKRYPKGSHWVGKVNVIGGDLDCGTLKKK